ncbi:hypothetical protein SH668x_001203 [Planctomicrobium sp. SH668]|uniref:hypothetical protein n=1 Tax=Planctomicrobium sp. SH668 TaxID=3448126 RepID=UPI003F5B9D83
MNELKALLKDSGDQLQVINVKHLEHAEAVVRALNLKLINRIDDAFAEQAKEGK